MRSPEAAIAAILTAARRPGPRPALVLRSSPIRTTENDEGRVLRCTGRANPPALVRVRPRRPAGPRDRLSRTRPTPIPTTTSTSRGRSRPGHGLNVDFIWIFAEVGGKIPPIPVLPIPSNAHWLPLATILQAPFISLFGRRALATRDAGVLIGSLAAPLTWLIARDAGAAAARRDRRRRPRRAPGRRRRSSWPSPRTSRSSSRSSRRRSGSWPRGPEGRRPRVRRWPGLLAGLASLARNDGDPPGRRGRARRSSPIGCARVALGAARVGADDPVPGRRRLLRRSSCSSWRPWWARQLAVFGSISPTASSGAALWIRTIAEWNSITAQPSLETFLAQGSGPILAARGRRAGRRARQLRGDHRLASSSCRSCSSAAGAAGARSTSGRGSLYTVHRLRRRRDPLPGPRPGRRVHPLGDRARAARLHPRARGRPRRWSAWIAGAGAALERRGARSRVFVTARRRVRRWPCVPRLRAVASRRPGTSRGQPRIAARRARSTRLGVARGRPDPVDRRRGASSTGPAAAGVVTPDDPIDTIEAVARAYDTRWLVLERDDAVGRARRRSSPASRARRGSGRRSSSCRPPTAGCPRWRSTRSASTPATTGATAAGRLRDASRRRVTRREAVLSAVVVFVVALVVRWYAATWSSSRSPRTRPTTSASRATSSRAAACLRRALELPDAAAGRSRAPAFEVWLPLPTFLAAIPMALFGATFAAAQVARCSSARSSRSSPGASPRTSPTERGLPPGRARTLAIGTGLTAAVYLPLLLHSALPDSTMLFAALRRSAACLLMSADPRAPRPRPAARRSADRAARSALGDRASGWPR